MFTDEEISYLRGQRIGRLATARPDGTLQVNPVGFGVNTTLGTIDVGGFRMERSRKFGNVAANGQVAFVVDDVLSTDPWRVRFVEIRGRGEALTEPTDSAGQTTRSGPIIRIHPTRVLTLALSPEDQQVDPHEAGIRARDVG
ncbi:MULTISPECIES: PPOX class F420-dependent oxidoreductase [Pseudonocardia]|jgi:pyridoxamine 5'-phosphate oxidase family protein|uniref:Pyridoxamine 5'-phosphate oxidase family protein n=1 Tax=Pseudonocardia alni TaxID=33907 RepID=A0A852VVV5_PSEA5|nr:MULTISPECIES: PPOX class F420-dependent oxidoreductase [Pseudonocardia]OJG08577.1 Pyridoxamine 5'-phosphate oxidase [Pseudonocardia autotrophica]MCM3847184.1 PPOX class F420-dependent oxidoreductase [Pseudonocardia sp. DR1-2]MCO7194955.1 PPOX class F420-dependent oxidoreductase [Pseudonocardia sp. McavD-2-B]MYW76067.1 PPOX class F420-dependent oxidoreductase [Pseudonocardia sp. SID8383]NYG00963.1 pyridoxamine 5'-phosphate oxidase family protein [Pseudonocardia antarctica]